MIKISYYRAAAPALPRAFCMLAEKCYHNSIVAFAYTPGKDETIELDMVLWTYSRKQFIPHGTIYDPFPEKQPILIGDAHTNLNRPSALIIINANKSKILSLLATNKEYTRLLFLYDQSDIASSEEIENMIATSAIREFRFESYTQGSSGGWKLQDGDV